VARLNEELRRKNVVFEMDVIAIFDTYKNI
jgi:hypothetical protein